MGIMSSPAIAWDWKTASPESVGLAGDLQARLAGEFGEGLYQGLHALLIVRDGKLAIESYFEARDETWGKSLGLVSHGPTTMHDLRSVTKSIVGLLYGMALHDGHVPAVTARLFEAFPDHANLLDDPLKRRITIGHVLSMRMGLAWHEDFAYADPNNGELRMEAAADRYSYILGLPMAERPGSRWVYSGGASALLGHLIARGTGQKLDDFAATRLFAPLGIGNFNWIAGSDGLAAASSGLRMTARDLARIGLMVLDRGYWTGRRVVPSSWISSSMKPRAVVESGLSYGYQWWLGNLVSTSKPWFAAYGNGGQRLIVIPSLKMVIVILAGNYNAADQWKMPVKLMTRIVMPAVQRN
jgi:CubicO group peptidase (beta-lactamase class C family)